jgi:TRAP transporter TAXI family solute receptor
MKEGFGRRSSFGARIASVFITFVMVCLWYHEAPCDLKPKTLIWGSASLGASGYVIIEALTSTLNRNEKSFRSASISTQGSTENLVLLSQKEIHLGQTTSSDLYLAYNGLKPFQKKIDFTQVLSYTYWDLPIGVLKDSPIKKIEDLDGKRVSLGPAGGATVAMWQAIFEQYGIKVTPIFLPWQGAADALKIKQIDAVVISHLMGKMPIPAFEELRLSSPYRLLDTDVEKIKRVSEKNHGIIVSKLTGDQVVNAPGYTGVLVADPELEEDAIRKIAKDLEFFRLENAIKMVVPQYPIHKGAVKFYKEKGFWREGLPVSK